MARANHMIRFTENLKEVDQLMKIHAQITGKGRGRRANVQTLNKSAIVLTTAVWETFIEELVSASFDFMISNANDHKVIPYSVLTRASAELKNDKDARRVWELADSGWKEILRKYKRGILQKEIDYFHVPRPENINELYEKLIGFQNVTSNWKWRGKSNEQAKQTLNDYIDLRGSIAHKLKSDKNVLKKDVVYYRRFLNCLATITHNRVNAYLRANTRKKAWDPYKFKTIT